MKRSLWEKAGNEPMFMLILAILLCLTALWAVSCGGGDNTNFRGQVLVGLSSGDLRR